MQIYHFTPTFYIGLYCWEINCLKWTKIAYVEITPNGFKIEGHNSKRKYNLPSCSFSHPFFLIITIISWYLITAVASINADLPWHYVWISSNKALSLKQAGLYVFISHQNEIQFQNSSQWSKSLGSLAFPA